jgi:hypothetical protein
VRSRGRQDDVYAAVVGDTYVLCMREAGLPGSGAGSKDVGVIVLRWGA